MIFTFVVLHYMVPDETIECVNSILNNVNVGNAKLNIVVVDNGSTNDSFSILSKEFTDEKKVVLLRSQKNLGFARGNNIGYKYAKEILKSDYIALINNDTIIYQDDWIMKANELYKMYDYAVLGPDIITMDNYHQNPFYPTKWNLKSLRRARMKQKIKLILTYIGIDELFLKHNESELENKYLDHEILDADLHGACFVFSRNYIDIFDGLCEDTFLYMEEEILKLYIDMYHLHTLYSPQLTIYHKEDAATNAVSKTPRKKKITKYKYWLESSKVLEKLLISFKRSKE
nr:glycosyltransferase [Streptococcus lutetiensis]